jgi:hypothetical protein
MTSNTMVEASKFLSYVLPTCLGCSAQKLLEIWLSIRKEEPIH